MPGLPGCIETKFWTHPLIASENQPDEGEMAWLAATLEECLESLGILLNNQGAKPSGTFSRWRLARANWVPRPDGATA